MDEASAADAAASSGGGRWYTGMSSDNVKGLVLALSSSLFIGTSFIIKKKGLKKAASSSGVRAGVGGYSYLFEPLWWVGMITMVVGEVANFAAYAFAPAILVTPLGALSIIISAVLAHVMLREKLHIFGILGCVLCVVGSTTIVLHAPPERQIESVTEVWGLATEPAFACYVAIVLAMVAVLVYKFVPLYGQTHVMVYIAVCSLVGSISVMSVKALGIALKVTFSGTNQLIYPQTWAFTTVVIACVIAQMNYLNKALDTFNTAVVSPIYYTMFTSLTILASVIMFKDLSSSSSHTLKPRMLGVGTFHLFLCVSFHFIPTCMTGTGKIRHRSLQRCAASSRSFRGRFCFTKQRTWLRGFQTHLHSVFQPLHRCGLPSKQMNIVKESLSDHQNHPEGHTDASLLTVFAELGINAQEQACTWNRFKRVVSHVFTALFLSPKVSCRWLA